MIVLHVAPLNTKTANGFRFSVPGLIDSQKKCGIEVALANISSPNIFDKREIEKKDFNIFQISKLKLDSLPSPFNKPDLIIFHGVYNKKYLRFYKELIKKKIPYVIVPRVSLTKGAQAQKKIKKVVSNFLFFNSFIEHAASIHYLTENEKKASSNYKKKCFVVGNGIDIPKQDLIKNGKVKKINFIGRFDLNHKGLDNLLLAISYIQTELLREQVQLGFYGTDYNNGKQKMIKFIKDNKLEAVLKIYDPIFGEDKAKVLEQTDIFIAPSRFEGHPMAVIEAMSYGIPCILTEGTNLLDKLKENNFGWETTLLPEEIGNTILEAIKSQKIVKEKGIKAREVAIDSYSWIKVGEATIEHYKKIIKNQ